MRYIYWITLIVLLKVTFDYDDKPIARPARKAPKIGRIVNGN